VHETEIEPIRLDDLARMGAGARAAYTPVRGGKPPRQSRRPTGGVLGAGP